MLLMPDKKKLATVIVSKLKSATGDGPAKSYPGDEKPESDSSIALGSAFDKLAEAVSRRDSKAGVEALKEFIYLAQDDKDDEDEANEPGEASE